MASLVRTIVLTSCCAFAQQSFEVASIRRTAADSRSGTFGCRGGPGTKTPTRWSCHGVTAPTLIATAYSLKPYQMTGDFMIGSNLGLQFDIEATIADGATEEAFRGMQADLLKNRFGLKLHFKETQVAGFDLTAGKNKLRSATQQEMAQPPATDAGFPGPPVIDKDGFPTLPNSTRPFLVMMNGRARWIASNSPIRALADLLEQQLRAPVADSTGLAGRYNFALKWGTQRQRRSDDDDPTLLEAVQEQLGLKILSKRITISVPVVDHLDKNPTVN